MSQRDLIEQHFNQRRKMLLKHLFNICKDYEMAADSLQEAYMTVLMFEEGFFENYEHVSRFVYVIAKRIAITAFNKKRIVVRNAEEISYLLYPISEELKGGIFDYHPVNSKVIK